ncbi:hypothetical protein ACO22_08151 [Paracoccidioides brasiliensis]|uniref:Uncharacterized protein n=1 Tax=Paracoccidioides brasiliensis TaxID=121759 RepID=A0A1D2J2N3_PARBR|nr:hypothetical protein ACO22_08151 [Paracoccidioides brasiliensis]ODH47501.1 hypothetical protein GX48_06415 [Paracoccidioides brasiliensis]
MPTDLEQLVEMGFDAERAQLAVSTTGGLQGALEWLETNQDKSLDEIKASISSKKDVAINPDEPPALKPGEEARSLVCNECGKKFRSQAQAEFHASKTEHVDFSESTEEIAPLTEEEKRAKLSELREKLAAKRAQMSEQDKINHKRNEEIRKKSTKETQDIKEELQKKERLKEAAEKRRERQTEIEARMRAIAKIEADKEERRQRAAREKAEREGRAPPPAAAVTTPLAPATSKPASAYTECRLRLQTPKGNVIKTFPVDTTLFEVAAALSQEGDIEVQSFTQNFPRKVYNVESFGETLKELGLIPSANLIVK